jgi:septal ring-binding cell division protein DamX
VEDLQGDWNTAPVDKVNDVQQSLEADADELRAIVDKETDSERLDQPALLDRPWASEPAPAEATHVAQPVEVEQPPAITATVAPANPDNPLAQHPADHYTVQLMTMVSERRLNAYLADKQLTDLPTARVERDGQIKYVLLLGVYESFALAQQALANDIPDALDHEQAWIRRLGSLQADMRRAAALAEAPPSNLAAVN